MAAEKDVAWEGPRMSTAVVKTQSKGTRNLWGWRVSIRLIVGDSAFRGVLKRMIIKSQKNGRAFQAKDRNM